MARHTIFGGEVSVYKRPKSSLWQCAASLKGVQYRTSTKEDSLERAKEFAEDWYLGLRGKSRAGLLRTEKSFKEAAKQFEKEYEVITEGQRSPRWVEGHKIRIRLHLNPFFGDLGLSEVTPGKVQEYRMHRIGTSSTGKPPARSTIHDEIVTLRQVLKTAVRHNWLSFVPDLSPPYRTQGKVVHRPWFSPEEYTQLYKASGEYAKTCPPRHRWNAEQVHDYILFMGNTGLRPDEAKNLQHRDVSIVDDEDTGKTILLIEVRGKRGFGYCKSMPGAVHPYERLRDRTKPKTNADKSTNEKPLPTDPVFPGDHKKLFNGILNRTNLKLDRDGNRRTAYSLRHFYISKRLLDGADPWMVAKNCRTSVEMIEKFYAAHIRNAIDASAINVRKRPRK